MLKGPKHLKLGVMVNYIPGELPSSSQFFLALLRYILHFQNKYISSHGFILLAASIHNPVNLYIHANTLMYSSGWNRLHKTTRMLKIEFTVKDFHWIKLKYSPHWQTVFTSSLKWWPYFKDSFFSFYLNSRWAKLLVLKSIFVQMTAEVQGSWDLLFNLHCNSLLKRISLSA